MPLIAALVAALEWAAGSIVIRVLLTLGISFASYSGIDVMLTQTQSQIISALGSFGGVTSQLFGVLQVGTAINIIVSAFTTRMLMSGVIGGKLTKMITKS